MSIINKVLIGIGVLFLGACLRGYHVCNESKGVHTSIGLCDNEIDNHFQSNWTSVFELIVIVVSHAVDGYFKTFTTCWKLTGSWLVEMIDKYIQLLMLLVNDFTKWILGTLPLALKGYFRIFYGCWKFTETCLTIMILRYISFLDNMVEHFTEWPSVIPLCLTGVACVYILHLMLKDVLKKLW